MAITVREIGVKVRVRGKEPAGAAREDAPPAPAAGLSPLQREELTEECVRRVLDVLRREREP